MIFKGILLIGLVGAIQSLVIYSSTGGVNGIGNVAINDIGNTVISGPGYYISGPIGGNLVSGNVQIINNAIPGNTISITNSTLKESL